MLEIVFYWFKCFAKCNISKYQEKNTRLYAYTQITTYMHMYLHIHLSTYTYIYIPTYTHLQARDI